MNDESQGGFLPFKLAPQLNNLLFVFGLNQWDLFCAVRENRETK